jgi:ABC-type uncharacterized transport system permease subunit
MLSGITLFCFGASYGVALVLEIVRIIRPRPIFRVLGIVALGAGLLAHTLFLVHNFFIADHKPPLASQFGSLLFVAWILAVFALGRSLHHPKTAWNLFVLPLVLTLVGLAAFFRLGQDDLITLDWRQGELVWGAVHGILLLLAAVGVCVGCLASVMFLIQSRRLRDKVPPGHGLQLFSLERLEEMNRHGLMLAFPLLTAGVLIGLMLTVARADAAQVWADPKVWATAGLWLAVVLLLYLRLARRLRGRQAAWLTIIAFGVMIVTLVASHTVVPVQGSTP